MQTSLNDEKKINMKRHRISMEDEEVENIDIHVYHD